MAGKSTYIARRTQRVGIGDLTFDLVAGEEIPKLPPAIVDVLLENQQVDDVTADPERDVYSQEYRDLQTFEDAEEEKEAKKK